MSALRYQAYLTMGHGIAKAVAPNILVISAAPAPITHADGVRAIDDKRFLDKLFEYDGLDRLDCIGAHANGPSIWRHQYCGDAICALAERSRPICVTECGYALTVNGLTPPDFAWAMRHTQLEQTRAVAGLRWACQTGDVRLAILWNWNYYSEKPSDINAPYALNRPGWRSPALAALREELAPAIVDGRAHSRVRATTKEDP